MANGMTGLVVAIAVASTTQAVSQEPAPGSAWDARNRERAREGLLPRKVPPPTSRFDTIAGGAPTAVPPAAETPQATTAPPTSPPVTTPPALAAATPPAPAPQTAAAPPIAPAPSTGTPARLVSARADVRADIVDPQVDSSLVIRTGDARLVVKHPSAPAPTRSAPAALPRHPPGLLARTWTSAGEQVHRVVDPDGRIFERRVDARGVIVEVHVVGDATALPLIWQKRRVDGDVVQVVRDVPSGALIALTRDGGGHLLDARVHPGMT